LPESGADGVRVECVDAVVFGGDEDDVVSAFAGDGDALNVKRLSVDAAVTGLAKSLPKFVEATFAGVRIVSLVLAPVRKLSLCCVTMLT